MAQAENKAAASGNRWKKNEAEAARRNQHKRGGRAMCVRQA